MGSNRKQKTYGLGHFSHTVDRKRKKFHLRLVKSIFTLPTVVLILKKKIENFGFFNFFN